MKCQYCENLATVHVTEVLESKHHELHLCDNCAKEHGAQLEVEFTLSDFLQGLISAQASDDHGDDEAGMPCPECGITLKEFRQMGRLGCPHDYSAFGPPLRRLVRRIHGASHHCGKVPQRAGQADTRQADLIRMRQELQAAIEVEAYERAAELRDAIREMEGTAGVV